jgi:hypothetical protein
MTLIQFETISHFLSPREPPPSMHLDRTDEEEDITLPSPTTRRKEICLSPRPSLIIHCLVYGYDGIILEVSESSQVVSVMLF